MSSGSAVIQHRSNSLADLMRSYSLADLAVGRANNFNLLRFLAATLVIVSHCCALAYGNNPEPILLYFGFMETGGSLGVLIFFAISGFLVVQSFVSRGKLKNFLAARALRIYPGLVSAVIFSIVLAGISSTLPWRAFLTDRLTRKFLVHNALAYPIEFNLPGAFPHNPLPGVNGSLWTLPLEIQMYLVVAALGVFGLLAGRELYNAVFAGFIILAASVKPSDLPLIADHPEALRLAIAFLCGGFCYLNRDRIRISIPWALLFAAVIVWGHHKIPHIRFLYIPALTYITLLLGYHPRLYFAPFNRLGDYSYGLYIYAFPTQQLVAHLNRGIGAVRLFFIAFPFVLAMAVVSWHFIEKPALRHKPS
jgi:peptidoglycan/LPS O-acetylase OafA/YrhL